MEERQILWKIGGMTFSPYAGFIAVGVLLGIAVFLIRGRKEKAGALALTVVLAVPLGLLCARAFYVLARFDEFAAEFGFDSFFRAKNPDYAIWGAANGAGLWGAVGGAALGALAAGKCTGTKVSRLLDALAPAGALAIALSRLGEFSIGEGIGPTVTEEAFAFFPLAVINEWEEWNFAVFLLESLVALLLFCYLLRRNDLWRDGDRARAFLLIYSACQIVLEALRRDNFMRWLFVRVSQVTAAVVLLGLLVFGILRWMRRPEGQRIPKRTVVICCAAFLLLAGVVVLLEFGIDKSAELSIPLAYLLEAGCAAGMGTAVWRVALRS